MPKAKSAEKKIKAPAEEMEKIVEIDTEDKLLDDDLVEDEVEDAELEEDELGLDEEEVDPFKDKWEE